MEPGTPAERPGLDARARVGRATEVQAIAGAHVAIAECIVAAAGTKEARARVPRRRIFG